LRLNLRRVCGCDLVAVQDLDRSVQLRDQRCTQHCLNLGIGLARSPSHIINSPQSTSALDSWGTEFDAHFVSYILIHVRCSDQIVQQYGTPSN
jgi:hypothetical protein